MKTVLITGAAGNLGAACVNAFAGADWQVVAVVSPGKRPGASHPAVEYIELDLSKEKETAEGLEKLLQRHGAIDAALLLVGGFESGGLDRTDGAALQRMYSLNFETAFFTAKPLFRAMKERREGKIIFVGARPALDPGSGKNLVAYGLSKSLLFTFAGYLNAAAERRMAHVVVFSALDTPQNRAAMPKADRSAWVAPEKVAQVMLGLTTGIQEEVVVEIA